MTNTLQKTIYVSLPLQSAYVRKIASGLQEAWSENPEWDMFIDSEESLLSLSNRGFVPSKVIGFFSQKDQYRKLCQMHERVLNVSNHQKPEAGEVRVTNDDVAIGHMAATHFLDQAYERIYFFSPQTSYLGKLRWQGIQQACRESGGEAFLLENIPRHGSLKNTLCSLPFPAAVITENDRWKVTVMRELTLLGIRCPMDIAVLGVDNDEILCNHSRVPSSSVRPDGIEIGRRAFSRIIGESWKEGIHITVPPEGVEVRLSTQGTAVPDDRIRRAIQYIHEHFTHAPSMNEVALQSGLSRRNLDLLFQTYLQTTPLHWMQRVQIQEAKRLLRMTRLPQKDIAERCGFSSHVQFWRTFKRFENRAPGSIRGLAPHFTMDAL